MLGRHVGLVALVALGATGLVAVGCGSDDPAKTDTTGSAGQPAGGSSAGGSSAGGSSAGGSGVGGGATEDKYKSKPGEGEPPAKPAAAPPGDGAAPIYFAVRQLYVGDTDFNNNASDNAWKDIGFNIDGYTSDKDFSGQCKEVTKQVRADIRTDGTNGIDNAFGNIIIAQKTLPIDNASQAATGAIEGGSFSLLMKFANLGTGKEYSEINAQVLPVGMPEGVIPKFDGKDSWSPFDPTDAPPIDFKGGWVAQNTWVSGSKGTLPLNLEISGIKITLAIQQAQISAEFNDDHTEVVKGIIGGSLETTDLITSLKGVAGSQNLCGAAFDSIAEQIKAASDSLKAGGQDPAVTCDSISIGIGFKATLAAAPGANLPKSQPKPDPCAGQLARRFRSSAQADHAFGRLSPAFARRGGRPKSFLALFPLPLASRFAYVLRDPLARSLHNDEASSHDLSSRPRSRPFWRHEHGVDAFLGCLWRR
jgi:hypothetical protein